MNNWRELVTQKKYAEADSLIEKAFEAGEMSGDDVESWGLFYEEWGDRAENSAEKKALYRKADYYFSIFASWSTSGGEGTARMRAVNTVRLKIQELDKKELEIQEEITDWRKLLKEKKFVEAEKLMLKYTANVVHGHEIASRADFYEKWGDAAENKDERKRYYEKARADFYIYASQATGSGEGLQRMMDIERVEKKVARLDEKSLWSRIGLVSIVAKVLRKM